MLVIALLKERIESDHIMLGSYNKMILKNDNNEGLFIREWDLKSDKEDSNIDVVEHLVTTIKHLNTKDLSNEQQIVLRLILILVVVEFYKATPSSLNKRYVVSGSIDRMSCPSFVIEVLNNDNENDKVLL